MNEAGNVLPILKNIKVCITMLLLLFSSNIFGGFLTVEPKRGGFNLCKLRFRNGFICVLGDFAQISSREIQGLLELLWLPHGWESSSWSPQFSNNYSILWIRDLGGLHVTENDVFSSMLNCMYMDINMLVESHDSIELSRGNWFYCVYIWALIYAKFILTIGRFTLAYWVPTTVVYYLY